LKVDAHSQQTAVKKEFFISFFEQISIIYLLTSNNGVAGDSIFFATIHES